jgi:hypothetical protein
MRAEIAPGLISLPSDTADRHARPVSSLPIARTQPRNPDSAIRVEMLLSCRRVNAFFGKRAPRRFSAT